MEFLWVPPKFENQGCLSAFYYCGNYREKKKNQLTGKKVCFGSWFPGVDARITKPCCFRPVAGRYLRQGCWQGNKQEMEGSGVSRA